MLATVIDFILKNTYIMLLSYQPLPSRIGVIGDIHAEPVLLRSALVFLSGLGIQAILCTGDIADGAGNVDDCVALLDQFGVVIVRGNHDKWLLDGQMRNLSEATHPTNISRSSLEFIRQLPATLEFETDRGKLLLCHGIGEHDMARIMPDDYGYAIEQNFELQDVIGSRRYRWMINGHTHRRMVRKIGGLTIINAGTLKQTHDPCFLTIDFEAGIVRFYSIGPSKEMIVADNFFLGE